MSDPVIAEKLEQLFKDCDRNSKGWIDLKEFQDLCAGLGIGAEDCDAIFEDLDQDGDGKIDFKDFSFGLKDFLTPGQRRESVAVRYHTRYKDINEIAMNRWDSDSILQN